MSYYIKDGQLLWPTEKGAIDLRDHLPVGTYTVGSSMKGFFLKPINDFVVDGKIYGDTTRYADRIMTTFADRPASTGVLLSGEKGSGKTLLAKLLSQEAAKQGISTLVINAPLNGDEFNGFIQSIDEPCIIVFDEFEKVFAEEQQEAILTLLDGVFPSKKLFVMTVNNKYRVNNHMQNRPGRIFYMIDYAGLDQKFIREYCEDNLKDKSHIDTIVRMSMVFDAFNFDMLKALVEEMNRYDETPTKALEILNAKPASNGGQVKHTIKVFKNGEEVPEDQLHTSEINGIPLARDEYDIGYNVPTGKVDEFGDEDTDYQQIRITSRDLKDINTEKGTFTYVINDGTPNMAVVVFTRQQTKLSYNWQDYMS